MKYRYLAYIVLPFFSNWLYQRISEGGMWDIEANIYRRYRQDSSRVGLIMLVSIVNYRVAFFPCHLNLKILNISWYMLIYLSQFSDGISDRKNTQNTNKRIGSWNVQKYLSVRKDLWNRKRSDYKLIYWGVVKEDGPILLIKTYQISKTD